MLHTETITSEVYQLILSLQHRMYLQDFFLVGGTGLSLQIAHRKSDDIDLFTRHDFDVRHIQELLETDFRFITDLSANNTLKGSISGIKIDLLTHPNSLIHPVQTVDAIRLASVDDISAMKLNDIANDGTRVKDFIDIYFLLGEMDIRTLFQNYTRKYSLRNPFHALKSLQYFDEVIVSDWPVIIRQPELAWEAVKTRIVSACEDFHQSL